MDFESTDSDLSASSLVYSGARIKSSTLHEQVSVGNFSRVDFSTLQDFCRIDRNNHLFWVEMGRHSYTGMNTVMMHAEVGAFCSISWNVSVGGADHDYRRIAQHSFLYNEHDKLRPSDEQPPYNRFDRPLKIGHDVWIAAGAVVTRGVEIGNGAVIGANSVVRLGVPLFL